MIITKETDYALRILRGRQGSNPCYSAKVTVPHGIVTFYFIETAESNV